MKILNICMLLLLMVSASCENNLEEVPLSFFEESNSFNSAADATSAINAVYDRLKGVYGMTMINLADLNGDECQVREENGGGTEIHKNLFNSGTGLFDQFYTASYVLIDRANRVIGNVPKITMDVKLRDQIVGEAKFIRALAYFNLVRAFGDVPLVTAVSNDVVNVQIPRDAQEQVYQQIIQDLQEAEKVLPVKFTADTEIGRATSGAAKSILAKVYLTRKDWTNAAAKAKEVIDSKAYSLVPDYHDLFVPEKENGPEHIFSIQYSCVLPTYGSQMAVSFAIFFTYPINLTGGTYQVVPAFASSFQQGDYRKEVTVITEKKLANGTIVASRTGPHTDKYWDPLACGESSARNNFIVTRYADVLLMYAEALNELGAPTAEAYNAINLVRARARNGAAATVLPDLAGLSQAQFRDAVLQERGWELSFEGHRRWDLLRTGKYVEAMKAIGVTADAKHLLYPIPLQEIDVNPALVQNAGY
ncbi:RagB/SusD family nutrient uptake outer membrane protein [Dyadobacter pollutisoli]|uniref:RagB/SusD family nutrient uptake outer membrane protein n=1 Tax=Dyadobacter pollutisoli TaxID=2910158 RepID=A0A9E8SMG4_9BACT|nr:RagB/SusD family nutrient uptake outer membrane protein [Dyadobacter pollutisoli]WAC14715.1 RagB/SusD family nutrient uptake outer membrane protein [Dyadobacter pollutisoli]